VKTHTIECENHARLSACRSWCLAHGALWLRGIARACTIGCISLKACDPRVDCQCWHVHRTMHQTSAKGAGRQAFMFRSLLNIMHHPVYDPFYPHDHCQEAARCRVRVIPMMCPIVPDGAPPQSQSTDVHHPSAWVHPLCGHPIVGSRLWAIVSYRPSWSH
jgi:hypothetical protein